jgi:hypothetical protein
MEVVALLPPSAAAEMLSTQSDATYNGAPPEHAPGRSIPLSGPQRRPDNFRFSLAADQQVQVQHSF